MRKPWARALGFRVLRVRASLVRALPVRVLYVMVLPVMVLVLAACTDDSQADDPADPGADTDRSVPSAEALPDQVALSIKLDQITSCDTDGNRRVFLTSSAIPADSVADVQWLYDDEVISAATVVGTFSHSVIGDGEVHTFEIGTIPPAAPRSAGLEVEVPTCDESSGDGSVVSAEIESVTIGDCDGAGFRQITLDGGVRPSDSDVTVQWFVDGQPLAEPGPVRSADTQIAGDGQVLVVELRVLSPEDGLRAAEDVEVETCEPSVEVAGGGSGLAAEIESVTVGDCDGAGFRQVTFVGGVSAEGSDDSDGSDVTVQWFLDGEALAAPGPVGPASVVVTGDGKTHVVELRLLSPVGGADDTDQFAAPACDTQSAVAGEIISLDVGDCDPTGFRLVTLAGGVSPAGTEATVQWIVDGRALGAPGPLDMVATQVAGDGQTHTAELRVLLPDGSADAIQEFQSPSCPG